MVYNCPNYNGFCQLGADRTHDKDKCDKKMSRYYFGAGGLICPTCKNVTKSKYDIWYEVHKSHLSAFTADSKKNIAARINGAERRCLFDDDDDFVIEQPKKRKRPNKAKETVKVTGTMLPPTEAPTAIKATTSAANIKETEKEVQARPIKVNETLLAVNSIVSPASSIKRKNRMCLRVDLDSLSSITSEDVKQVEEDIRMTPTPEGTPRPPETNEAAETEDNGILIISEVPLNDTTAQQATEANQIEEKKDNYRCSRIERSHGGQIDRQQDEDFIPPLPPSKVIRSSPKRSRTWLHHRRRIAQAIKNAAEPVYVKEPNLERRMLVTRERVPKMIPSGINEVVELLQKQSKLLESVAIQLATQELTMVKQEEQITALQKELTEARVDLKETKAEVTEARVEIGQLRTELRQRREIITTTTVI